MENVPIKPKRCCVTNCRNLPGPRHRFPKRDINIFKKSVNIIKPTNYDSLTVVKYIINITSVRNIFHQLVLLKEQKED